MEYISINLGNWKNFEENVLRLKPRYTFNKGFFSSIINFLDILPHLDKNDQFNQNENRKIIFNYYSHNYGSYPNFNVIGKYLISKIYSTEMSMSNNIKYDKIISTNDIKLNNRNYLFGYNFNLANHYFFKYFDFSPEIYNEVNEFTKQFEGKRILGLHFRGTDKLRVNWVDHIEVDSFLKIVDYHLNHNEYDGIFFSTDSLSFQNIFTDKYKNNYLIYYVPQNLTESAIHLSRLTIVENAIKNYRKSPLLENILKEECCKNEQELRAIIVNMLILSKCNLVIKSHSQLSGFSKIVNPELEIYRLNGCKEILYPDTYIPFYPLGDNIEINNILLSVRRSEVSDAIKLSFNQFS